MTWLKNLVKEGEAINGSPTPIMLVKRRLSEIGVNKKEREVAWQLSQLLFTWARKVGVGGGAVKPSTSSSCGPPPRTRHLHVRGGPHIPMTMIN